MRKLAGFFGSDMDAFYKQLLRYRRPQPPDQQNYFTVGGVSKVWNGAGLGTVHSKPSAPSHGLAAAFSPPRIDGNRTKNKK